jgi:hypothetical protein
MGRSLHFFMEDFRISFTDSRRSKSKGERRPTVDAVLKRENLAQGKISYPQTIKNRPDIYLNYALISQYGSKTRLHFPQLILTISFHTASARSGRPNG